MSSCRPLFGAAVALCLFAGAAHATPIEWSYQWTPNTSFKIFAKGSTTDYIQANPEPSATFFGDATVPAVSLQTFSNATIKNPAVFDQKDSSYSLSLTIFDGPSGKSQTVSFAGFFSGTLWSTQADLKHTPIGSPEKKVSFANGDVYDVTLQVVPPGGPTAKTLGTIGAQAVVTVSHTPEPSGLALAGLGLTGLGFAGWLTRRARKAAPSLA
jgi:hypothetical protein